MNKKNSSKTARGAQSQFRDVSGARLGTAGRELLSWCDARFEISEVRPLVLEMCSLWDRLAQVRLALEKETDARLIGAETKLSSAFARAWRLAGFADSDVPKGRVGRPMGIPAQPRKVV